MTKSSISLIVLLFISSIAYNQEIIDKVIAVVGEKPILFSEVQSQKMQLAQQGTVSYTHLTLPTTCTV